jgi:hypothetical protein
MKRMLVPILYSSVISHQIHKNRFLSITVHPVDLINNNDLDEESYNVVLLG